MRTVKFPELKARCIDGTHNHKNCEDIEEYVVCHDCKQTLARRCEVYSRVVGYLRPVESWNDGKKSEFASRKTFNVSGSSNVVQ